MISELKNIVDLITKALDSLSKSKNLKKKKEIFTDLLEAYFHFKEIKRVGSILLDLGGKDPVSHVTEISKENIDKYVQTCYQLIIEQRERLSRVSKLIYDKPFLDVFGEELRKKIDKAIGTKEKGLLAVGASIEFYLMFGGNGIKNEEIENYGKEKAYLRYQGRIIHMINITDWESDIIDLDKAKENLLKLDSAAEELRRIIKRNCDFNLLLEISKISEKRSNELIRKAA